MSELKAILATPHPKMKNACDGAVEVYPKSEADKVIAKLKSELDRYKRGWEESDRINAHLYAELRHHKYKRCLSMASLWLERSETSTDLENELVSRKRCNKWLELAEKFKEVK